MRIIDADELIKEFLNVCRTEFEIKNKCLENENVLFVIQNAPTVDTTCPNCDSGYAQGYSDGYLTGKEERPQGEWIGSDGEYHCNKCYEKRWYRSTYCPQCGAYMRGGKEND